MRLNKFDLNKKNPGKQYRNSSHIGRECKNHGKCPECRDNRTYFDRRNRVAADMQLKEHLGQA